MTFNITDVISSIEGGDPRISIDRDDIRVDQTGAVSIDVRFLMDDESTSNIQNQWDSIGDSQVWIVFHGWNEIISDFVEIQEKIKSVRPDDTVLIVDWTQASGGVTRPNITNQIKPLGQGEVGSLATGTFIASSWIQPIAEKLHAKLLDWGLTDGNQVNIVGHSLGTMLGAELAANYAATTGKVRTLTALDSPTAVHNIAGNLAEVLASGVSQALSNDYDVNQLLTERILYETGFSSFYASGYDLNYEEAGQQAPLSYQDVANYSVSWTGSTTAAGNSILGATAHEAYLIDFQGQDLFP